jgi:carbon storage regulator CsrA
MLVLTRKQSETIQIGDSITITVLRMKGKSVRLGIQAPHDLNVIRGELAFEQPDEQDVACESDEADAIGADAKPKSRVSGPRQGNKWSTKSEPPATVKVGCAGAWSI